MSATSRHSPAIPLSPPSPPDTGVKERSKSHLIETEPQSPASPPLMSVATKSYASSFTNTQPSSDAATSQQSFSPPTSTPMSTQDHQQLVTADSAASPTAAGSISGLSRKHPIEDQDPYRNKRQKMNSADAYEEDKMDTDEPSLPSNHDRQNPEHVGPRAQGIESSETATARSILNNQLADNNLASDDMRLESLQKDMGDAFLLCKSSKTLKSSV
jgi:hypothetical protein